jgi:hypothetical protein
LIISLLVTPKLELISLKIKRYSGLINFRDNKSSCGDKMYLLESKIIFLNNQNLLVRILFGPLFENFKSFLFAKAGIKK